MIYECDFCGRRFHNKNRYDEHRTIEAKARKSKAFRRKFVR